MARLVGGVWLIAALVAVALGWPRRPEELAAFSTPLEGRTPNQAANARRAAAAIDGAELPPGGEFSFNATVGPWTGDRGYLPAPVSFGGEMVIADGGGVCQTSTTLYNAALLAGLEVIERDRHVWLPAYSEPGRDAAVAQGIADLRLRNPHPAAVTIHAAAAGERLAVRLTSPRRPAERWRVEVEPVALTRGVPLVRFERGTPAGVRRVVRPGRPGCRVRVWRITERDGQDVAREPVSDDEYQALSAVTHVGG